MRTQHPWLVQWKERNLNDVHMTKGGGVGWGWLQFLWHGRSWEAKPPQMLSRCVIPILTQFTILIRCFPVLLIVPFFSEYLKLSYIRTRYTVEFSPIVIFGLSHYNMCQFSTRSDTMKDRRQRTHNHFKFSTLKYQKYLKSWIIKGQISAQPHTIVKQICFPNGNVLFSHCFLCPRTECII